MIIPFRDPVRDYKRSSKHLLKAFRAGEPSAMRRVRAVLRRPDEEVCLQNVQHVVAREIGYESWKDLLDSVR